MSDVIDKNQYRPAGSIHSPRGYYHGWNIIAICLLTHISALALTTSSFSLFLPHWNLEFGNKISTLALSISLFSLATAIFSGIIGTLADRIAARKIFAAGLMGLVIVHITMSQLSSGWQLLVIYTVALPACVTATTAVPSQALVSRWFARRSGLAMGLTSMGISLPGIVAPPLVVIMLPLIGWRIIWISWAALIALLVLPLVWFFMRDRPSERELCNYAAQIATHGDDAKSLPIKDILRRRNFWIIVLSLISMQFCWYAVSVNLAPLVMAQGMTPGTAGALLAVASAAALLAKIIVGLLVDRFGNRPPLMTVTLVSASGVLMVASAGPSFGALFLGAGLVGITGSIWTLASSMTQAEFGGAGFGRTFGLVCMAAPLGTFGAPIIARIAEANGNYNFALFATVAVALFGFVVSLQLKENRTL